MERRKARPDVDFSRVIILLNYIEALYVPCCRLVQAQTPGPGSTRLGPAFFGMDPLFLRSITILLWNSTSILGLSSTKLPRSLTRIPLVVAWDPISSEPNGPERRVGGFGLRNGSLPHLVLYGDIQAPLS